MQSPCPYDLRPAKNSDGDAIRSLISGVLRDYGIPTNLATTEKDLADIEANYQGAGGAFLVLVDQEKLIGTVALCRESDLSCELCRMYLAAGYRRQGLGRMLLETALRQAAESGFSEVRLETAAVLKEAISLYQSVGFAVACSPPLGKNCNLVMSKRLK